MKILQGSPLLEGELGPFLYSDEELSSRKVGCVSEDERATTPEPRAGSTLSVSELDSTKAVRSQITPREVPETGSSDTLMKDLEELISEPSGSKSMSGDRSSSMPRVGMSLGTRKTSQEPLCSKDVRGDWSSSKPRVGMSSGTMKTSHSAPRISHSRVYTYDELIEY